MKVSPGGRPLSGRQCSPCSQPRAWPTAELNHYLPNVDWMKRDTLSEDVCDREGKDQLSPWKALVSMWHLITTKVTGNVADENPQT